jgi:PhoPQ-activated pathogenicity-related protein
MYFIIIITIFFGQSLAGWTFSLGSYYAQNITRYLDNPYFQAMADIVDPYAYFDRYRNVKILQFQAADDQYFPPDSEVFVLYEIY